MEEKNEEKMNEKCDDEKKVEDAARRWNQLREKNGMKCGMFLREKDEEREGGRERGRRRRRKEAGPEIIPLGIKILGSQLHVISMECVPSSFSLHLFFEYFFSPRNPC